MRQVIVPPAPACSAHGGLLLCAGRATSSCTRCRAAGGWADALVATVTDLSPVSRGTGTPGLPGRSRAVSGSKPICVTFGQHFRYVGQAYELTLPASHLHGLTSAGSRQRLRRRAPPHLRAPFPACADRHRQPEGDRTCVGNGDAPRSSRSRARDRESLRHGRGVLAARLLLGARRGSRDAPAVARGELLDPRPREGPLIVEELRPTSSSRRAARRGWTSTHVARWRSRACSYRTIIDPITLEVLKNAPLLDRGEMALVVMRSAYSPVVRDNMDFSTGFCDRTASWSLRPDPPDASGTVPDAMAASRRPGDELGPVTSGSRTTVRLRRAAPARHLHDQTDLPRRRAGRLRGRSPITSTSAG